MAQRTFVLKKTTDDEDFYIGYAFSPFQAMMYVQRCGGFMEKQLPLKKV